MTAVRSIHSGIVVALALGAMTAAGPSFAAGSGGIVYVTPHADGRIAALLDESFAIVPINNPPPNRGIPPIAHGLVVAGSDLSNPNVTLFAQRLFDEGRTVGIVDADGDDAESLRLLLGRSVPLGLEGTDAVPLVALRDDLDGARLVKRVHVLRPRVDDGIGSPEGEASADGEEAAWLQGVFDDLPAPPPPGDATDNLTELATSILVDHKQTDSHGNALQVTNNIWAARSFTSNVDYYYVQQLVVNTVTDSEGYIFFAVDLAKNLLASPDATPVIVQFSPGSTQNATTYTSGVSFGLGGAGGYMGIGGVLTVDPSLSISNSTSTTVQETQIEFSEPINGAPTWGYTTGCNNCNLQGNTFGYTAHWIWAVGFDQYAQDQESIGFCSIACLANAGLADGWAIDFTMDSVIDLPFNETELSAPTVTNVCPTTASPGDTVTVTGTSFYLINGVLIGGNAVPATNYAVVASNTCLSIDIPSDQPTGTNQSVVINTQEGISNDDVTITIQP